MTDFEMIQMIIDILKFHYPIGDYSERVACARAIIEKSGIEGMQIAACEILKSAQDFVERYCIEPPYIPLPNGPLLTHESPPDNPVMQTDTNPYNWPTL